MKRQLFMAMACLLALSAQAGTLGSRLVTFVQVPTATGDGLFQLYPIAGATDSSVYASENTQGYVTGAPQEKQSWHSAASQQLTTTVKATWLGGPNDPPPSSILVTRNTNGTTDTLSKLFGNQPAAPNSVSSHSSADPQVSSYSTVGGWSMQTAGDADTNVTRTVQLVPVTWHVVNGYYLETDQSFDVGLTASVSSDIVLTYIVSGYNLQGNSLSTAASVGSIHFGLPPSP